MNISLRWLQEVAPELEGADPDALAGRLAALGFPVESLQSLAEGVRDIVVGQVLEVTPHPNADRLRVCRVDGGHGEVQVVCGAPNVVAGGWYPLAPVGAVLPDGMEIRKAKLRGEVSEGMLCSERELQLGRDQGGLMTLQGAFKPGQPLTEALGLDDVRLEVEVTSNRPDLLSHRGVARELAPSGDAGLRETVIPGESAAHRQAVDLLDRVSDPREVRGAGVTLRLEDDSRCPRYLGLVIRGVQVGPSPLWLQNRLRAVGARPINNVVDATNFVLFQVGQPLHAFDLNQLAQQTIVIRRAKAGETMRTLDGIDRVLTPEMLAICDGARPAAVAGVMGGEEAEVSGQTTDVFLECALFRPGPIRATRKALGLSTDASYRFERGVDPEGLEDALRLAARIILATAGGEVVGPILDAGADRFARTSVTLRAARVQKVLGIPFAPSALAELLGPLGFQIAAGALEETLQVEVPGYRSYDVSREVDLIEEVARRHGYDAFPETLGAFRPGSVPDDPFLQLEDRIRDHLVAEGLFEAQTPAFAGEAEGEVALQNPISTEEGFLRRELLPALLRRLSYNLARGNRDVRLFEIGTTFTRGEAGQPPVEVPHLALVLHGARMPAHWTGEAAAWDLWDIKGLLLRLAVGIWGEGCVLRPAVSVTPPWAPDTCVELVTPAGVVVGKVGSLRPQSLDLPPWARTLWGAEVILPENPEPLTPMRYRAVPRHPGVDRDLALILPPGIWSEGVVQRIWSEAGPLLAVVEIFDQYQGKGLPDGARSVGFRLRFQAEERTLTEAEVEASVAAVLRKLDEDGIRLRGS
jgi:phenylalanyl-tRNA synthetase beta chain